MISEWFLILFLSAANPAEGAKKNRESIERLPVRDESTVELPVANEVCFSPGESCEIKLLKFIQSAKSSIDIAIFDITLDSLSQEIITQSKKISVRVVVDRRQSHGTHSAVATLIKYGVKVRIGHQSGGVMHNKFTIVDGHMVETGSFNYTAAAATKNNENQVYLSTPNIVDRYKARFEKIWGIGDEPAEIQPSPSPIVSPLPSPAPHPQSTTSPHVL